MKYLVRIGDAAFDISSIAAVEGDRVVFKDGKEIRVGRKTKEGLLAVLPEMRPGNAAGAAPADRKGGEG